MPTGIDLLIQATRRVTGRTPQTVGELAMVAGAQLELFNQYYGLTALADGNILFLRSIVEDAIRELGTSDEREVRRGAQLAIYWAQQPGVSGVNLDTTHLTIVDLLIKSGGNTHAHHSGWTSLREVAAWLQANSLRQTPQAFDALSWLPAIAIHFDLVYPKPRARYFGRVRQFTMAIVDEYFPWVSRDAFQRYIEQALDQVGLAKARKLSLTELQVRIKAALINDVETRLAGEHDEIDLEAIALLAGLEANAAFALLDKGGGSSSNAGGGSLPSMTDVVDEVRDRLTHELMRTEPRGRVTQSTAWTVQVGALLEAFVGCLPDVITVQNRRVQDSEAAAALEHVARTEPELLCNCLYLRGDLRELERRIVEWTSKTSLFVR